jgi:hypothetical protein
VSGLLPCDYMALHPRKLSSSTFNKTVFLTRKIKHGRRLKVKMHHHEQLQGLGLLACSDFRVRRTDLSASLVIDLSIIFCFIETTHEPLHLDK